MIFNEKQIGLNEIEKDYKSQKELWLLNQYPGKNYLINKPIINDRTANALEQLK